MKINNFNIGEKVSVIDEDLEGIITAINNKTITIEDSNGFLFNYNVVELVKVFSFNDKILDKKQLQQKDDFPNKNKTVSKTNLVKNFLEVDLHIHQITKSNKHLSNFEMLSRQIDYADLKIKYAIKNNIQKIVFIHGIGQGVLKERLIKLFEKYKVTINDANYQKYGRGATEIYIYKNN